MINANDFGNIMNDVKIEKFNRMVKHQEKIIKENMKQGYLEMSQININLSEMGLAEDIRELDVYETNLTGCEK